MPAGQHPATSRERIWRTVGRGPRAYNIADDRGLVRSAGSAALRQRSNGSRASCTLPRRGTDVSFDFDGEAERPRKDSSPFASATLPRTIFYVRMRRVRLRSRDKQRRGAPGAMKTKGKGKWLSCTFSPRLGRKIFGRRGRIWRNKTDLLSHPANKPI